MPRIEGTAIRATPDGVPSFIPVVVIRIEVGTLGVEAQAIVDSGAERTIVPAELTAALGADFRHLPNGEHGRGAGGTFESRPCRGLVRFREWTVCEEFLVAEPGALPATLLGRQDFFRRFIVRFQWHRDPPFFDVDPAPNAKR